MNLAIHILLACSVVVVGFCLVIAVRIINDMNEILARLCNKVDEMDKKQNSADAIRDGMRQAILAEFQKRYSRQNVTVVDDKTKPLDFPNGD